jgi:hypothetical protein
MSHKALFSSSFLLQNLQEPRLPVEDLPVPEEYVLHYRYRYSSSDAQHLRRDVAKRVSLILI